MKLIALIATPAVLALAISTAKADPSPTPEMGGAQTMPSGAEPESPPAATYDQGVPDTAPGTATTGTATPGTATPGTATTAPGTTDTSGGAPSGTMAPNTTDTAGAPATAPSGTMAPNTTDTSAAPNAADSDLNAATPPPGAPPTTETPSVNNNVTVLPPPPNGQTTEVAPVAPLPPMPGAPEGAYPGSAVASHIGVGLLVGGGFQDFTNSRLRDMTGSGGYWTARIVAGSRQFIGMEAAYVGDARGISGLGLGNDSRLISNGVEGDLRLNVPLVRGHSLVEPFGFVGVGWSHYTVNNNNAALSDLTSRDDVLTMPFGGGVEFGYKGFFADARYTYRETYFNNLTQTIGGNLNNWGVGGQVGFEY